MREPKQSLVPILARVLLTTIALTVVGCGRTAKVVVPPAIQGASQTMTFSAASHGGLPPEWRNEQTGRGDGSTWRVVADESSSSTTGYVLAQTAKSPRSMFNLCVFTGHRFSDLKLTVAFKAVAGDVDQGGGLVWRYVDANNYYVCRFNPLEDNLRIYKVIAGKRSQLASVDAQLPAGVWHTITATMKDDLIVCDADGMRVSVRDETLTEAGQVGLWTKADAQTRFDQFTVTGSAE